MKPGVIVLSADDDDTFHWLSDGWFCEKVRATPEAQATMAQRRELLLASSLDILHEARGAPSVRHQPSRAFGHRA